MSQRLFGKLTIDDFLHKHWQQKPLLVRHAINVEEVDIDPAELAGLCCDTEAPSRIVIEHGETPWQMKIGPFEEQDFTSLPADHWSLLINDIETYLPELQAFIEPFRFLPDWRIDDLMISYATDKGSVGPHVDDYDVFLIQLQGVRQWSIDENPDFDTSLLVGPSLKILQHFDSNQQWDLQPGDMLYLPPGVPHHGIAIGECMTLSVGFRAPSSGELVQSWLDDIGDNKSFSVRFQDAERKSQQDSGEISAQDLTELKAVLMRGITESLPSFDSWIGKYLSEGKRPDPALLEAYTSVTSDDNQQGYQLKTNYQRFPGTRLAYIKNDNQLSLFVGGVEFSLDHQHLSAVQYLCGEQEYLAPALASISTDPVILKLLNTLINNNKLVLMEHDPCDQISGDSPYS
jgi:50S ribosomal protein L16 3-hydroxylase